MALNIKKFTKTVKYYKEDDITKFIEKNNKYDNTYLVITNLNGTKEQINFEITIFNNAQREETIEKNYYCFTPSVADGSENFIKQCYEFLKTLDKYSGAEDC